MNAYMPPPNPEQPNSPIIVISDLRYLNFSGFNLFEHLAIPQECVLKIYTPHV